MSGLDIRLGSTREYTLRLADLLAKAFRSALVSREWRSTRNGLPVDPFSGAGALTYAQTVDIAVGPFAFEHPLVTQFDDLVTNHETLIEHLLYLHAANIQAFGSEYPSPTLSAIRGANPNPRCFIAVEIERGNIQPKYLLGSAHCAAAWGKLGIVVCWPRRLKTLLRVREMLAEQAQCAKNTFCIDNLLVLDCEQTVDILEAYISSMNGASQ